MNDETDHALDTYKYMAAIGKYVDPAWMYAISHAYGVGNVAAQAVSPAPRNPTPAELIDLLGRRLNKSTSGAISGFDYITAHKAAGDKVLVFIVTKDGKHTVLEDGWDMFPSDTLITQLRLLRGK